MQNTENNIKYLVAYKTTFDSLPPANEFLQSWSNKENLMVTYYMPQPVYKSWVPNWLIRLITKKS